MKIFFDGGSRPAGMEWAVIVKGDVQVERNLGLGTSMTAEWLALLAAMRIVRARSITEPVLLGDAAAVIAQALGRVRCPPAHLDHLAAWRRLCEDIGPCRLRYVKRTQNLAGIALERLRGSGADPTSRQ